MASHPHTLPMPLFIDCRTHFVIETLALENRDFSKISTALADEPYGPEEEFLHR